MVREFIEDRDYRIMLRAQRWRAPRWIRRWMIWATRGGDGWLWYSMGALLLLLDGASAVPAILESSLASGVGVAAFLRLKRATGRKRPCALEPHCWSSLLPPDQFSFPSGHAMTAFCVITPLLLHYPGLSGGLLFCALSVAASRIVLGLHFLSDVVAGAVIGSAIGFGIHCLLG